MKAMIFAAGLGTRLRPLTDCRPKALVEVGGVTMLERVVTKLRDAGINRMVVNVHHFPDMVIDFLKNHNNFGVDITVCDERTRLLDTGGGLLRAREWLDGDEPILVHNADILTDFSIGDMLSAHKQNGNESTLLVAERKGSRALLFNSIMRMEGWMRTDGSEIIPPDLDVTRLKPLAFGGVHIVNPSIFRFLAEYAESNGEVFSITAFYIAECNRMTIGGYIPSTNYKWFDIGSPEKLAAATASCGEPI